MRRLLALTAAAVLTALLPNVVTWAQQPNAEQRQQIAEANKLKAQVSSKVTGRKYDEAAKLLGQLEEAIKKLKEGKLSATHPSLVALERFVEHQKKILDRNKPKDAPKKDESGAAPSKASAAETSSSGSVSFVKDVAPVFARNCQGCHGANNPRSKFSLATFNNLMKGGERGNDDIVPGKPDESRLVLLLKGDEEPRMPLRGRALRRDLIEKIETWVKEGAKFDGAPKFTPNSTLADIVPSPEEELKMKVAAMTEPELLELHKEKAREHWTLGNPSKSPEMTETDHFIVMGTLPQDELGQAGQWAENVVKDLGRMFGKSPKDAVWKGKLTIHLFADRHEYTEHAMEVENREVPREILAHQITMIETSYAAVPKPTEDSPASLKGLVVEQVAAAYLAALGDTPTWFNTGVGRFLAARSDPKAEIYREYRQQVREAATAGDPVAALFDEKGDGDPGVLGFGLVDFLVTLRAGEKGLTALAAELRKKTAGDKAIQAVYGVDRKTLAASWTQFAVKKYPVAKKR